MSTEHDVIDVPLNITQELLDAGNEDSCPVAMAARIAMPGASKLDVGPTLIWFDAGGTHHRIGLPWMVRNTIDAIDNDFDVDPRVIVVPIPRSIAALPGFLADETLLSPRAVEAMPL